MRIDSSDEGLHCMRVSNSKGCYIIHQSEASSTQEHEGLNCICEHLKGVLPKPAKSLELGVPPSAVGVIALYKVGRWKLDPSLKVTCFQPLNLRLHTVLST